MEETTTVADSTPVAEAATGDPGSAATQSDVTHGDQTADTTTTDDASTESQDADSDDQDDDEATPEDASDEEKSKAQRRRERRQQREQQRIAEAVQAEVARREQEAATKAAAEKATKEAEAAQQQWHQEFGSFVGTPEVRATLAKEIDDLIQTTISVDPELADVNELQRLTTAQKALAEKRAELQRLNQQAEIYQKLDQFQFRNTQAAFSSLASALPEAHRGAYLASQTVDQALERLVAGIRADEQAKAKSSAEKLESEWRTRYEKEVAAHTATRTGAAGNAVAPGRANGTGTHVSLTPERYRQMSYEERLALRSTPEGRRQIDQMTRSQGGTRSPV